jgi:hypothetical protein
MKTTYKNRNGKPMIRKCSNCIHFNKIDDGGRNDGYCKNQHLYFAFTHERSVYAIVKDFYVCPTHEFNYEEQLKNDSEEVDLLSYLQDRNAEKKL